jgi:hypothetical protein
MRIMGTLYYLADTKHKRILLLGKQPGSFLCQWLRDKVPGKPIASSEIRAALQAFWDADTVERRYELDAAHADAFVAKVWAFCALADWRQEVRNDVGEYDDELLPVAHKWDAPQPDPAWKTIGSWYTGETLDPDPLAEEQERLELLA